MFSTITVFSLPPPKLSFSPQKCWDKLISESVDVDDINSGGVLKELLLLRMISFQSDFLVPWLLISSFLGFPGTDSAL